MCTNVYMNTCINIHKLRNIQYVKYNWFTDYTAIQKRFIRTNCLYLQSSPKVYPAYRAYRHSPNLERKGQAFHSLHQNLPKWALM